jgi:hypothetical protein
MVTDVIGVKELQKTVSHVVRAVQKEDRAFEVSVQGRPTGVLIMRKRGSAKTGGATVAQMLSSPLYSTPKDDDVMDAQIAALAQARDDAGFIAGRWLNDGWEQREQ